MAQMWEDLLRQKSDQHVEDYTTALLSLSDLPSLYRYLIIHQGQAVDAIDTITIHDRDSASRKLLARVCDKLVPTLVEIQKPGTTRTWLKLAWRACRRLVPHSIS
jgi:hypothetical protein